MVRDHMWHDGTHAHTKLHGYGYMYTHYMIIIWSV